MSRNLYRGRRIDNGVLIYGRLIPAQGKSYILDEEYIKECKDGFHDILNNIHEVIPATIGQSTSRIDSYGNLIFENDSVRMANSESPEDEEIFKISFDPFDSRWIAVEREGYPISLSELDLDCSEIIDTAFNKETI